MRKILQNLTKRNWLQRIEKGKYLIVPSSAGTDGHYAENELVVAAHLIAPYYISYWTALYHYSLTEQPVRTIFVATTQHRRSLTLNGITYRFITLTRRKFFGHTRVWIDDQAVEIADQTKVLVDGLDHPELCGGIVEVAKGLWHSRNEINWKKMETYAGRMGNRAIFKRLGYLLEIFDLGNANLRKRLKKKLSAGYVVLDPLSPRQGIHTARWGLIINIDQGTLTNWTET